MMGLDSGSTILNRIWKWLAPSSSEASYRLSGIVERMNERMISML